ncbi:MAG: hypothetical protein IJ356_06250 [Erysipelotrichaceae bacterium]|nr:hypothetical protein [Erysipelotrichaceae bacterium]
MFLFFGLAALLTAMLNLIFAWANRESKWFRFLSLSLTALTVCSLYSMNAAWVNKEDWSALMDVVPAVSKIIWFLVLASIILNGITLFKNGGKK